MLYAQDNRFKLFHGDNRDVLKDFADNSIDSIVTDPPYELGFMGKSWDASGIAFNVEVWQECLRVLKPGGHLLAFSGSRTYHRMAVAIEDAGFEIRDQIMWIYGSGFPKSLDVSKAIDKSDATEMRRQRDLKFTEWMRSTKISARQINELTESNMGNHYLTDKEQPAVATAEMFDKLRPYLPEAPEWVEEMVRERTIESENFKKRKVVSTDTKARSTSGNSALPTVGGQTIYQTWNITTSATAAAKQWQGWGTALKPAHEPIVVARKPLIGTVAANVLTYGTGGLNIDGARVGTEIMGGISNPKFPNGSSLVGKKEDAERTELSEKIEGRWPANVIHDGSDEVVELFPDTAPSKAGIRRNKSGMGIHDSEKGTFGKGDVFGGFNDSGSAARFFYCAKASKRDRNEGLDGFEAKRASGYGYDHGLGNASEGMFKDRNPIKANHHPTVKPTTLMQYLCKLVTPPGGVVLDPFAGSGSTGKAAIYEGFNFIGIEMTEEYLPIAKARIEFALNDEGEKLL